MGLAEDFLIDMEKEELEGVLAGLKADLTAYHDLGKQRDVVYRRVVEGVESVLRFYRAKDVEPSASAEPTQEPPTAEASAEPTPTPAAEPEAAPVEPAPALQPPEQAQETAPPPKSS